MVNRTEYEELIQQESEYWGEVLVDDFIDLRKFKKKQNPVAIWDDSVVESVMRSEYRERIVRLATRKSNSHVLELGCGAGWLCLEIARNGASVEGVDISVKCIEAARRYAETLPHEVGFGSVMYRNEDLNRITLKDASYDVVVAYDSLHHVLDIEHLLKEVSKSLRPGGDFLVFDHIGSSTSLGCLLVRFLYLLLPTDHGYCFKFKSLIYAISVRLGWRKLPDAHDNGQRFAGSPFEDVTGKEMVEIISRHLRIVRMQDMIGFSAPIVARIRAPEALRLMLVKMLKLLDEFLVRTGLLRGEYVSLQAKKE